MMDALFNIGRFRASNIRSNTLLRGTTVIAIAFIGALGGAAVTWLTPGIQLSLIIAIFVLILSVTIGKAIFGYLDPFEPLMLFAIMWITMFCVRPAAMLASGYTSLRGTYDAAPALTEALWLALLGAVCFLGGYCVPRPSLQKIAKARVGFIRRLTYFPTLTISVISGIAALVVILSTFGKGQTGGTAYVYYTPLLAVPVALLLLTLRARYGSIARIAAITITAIVVANYWLVGDRFFGLLPIAAIVVFYYLEHRRRPKLFSVLLALVILVLGLSWLENQRHQTSSVVTPTAQRSALGRFLLGGTTEELPAFSVEIETRNSLWSPRPGYLFYSVAVNWIPSKLWPNKPKSYAELLYSLLFPGNYHVARNGTEFSILGDFYYDSGPTGIIIGMVALGFLFRTTYDKLVRFGKGSLNAVSYAPIPPLMVILLRGDLTLILGLALFVYAPIVVVALVTKNSASSKIAHPVSYSR